MITDLCGFISLASTLFNVYDVCHGSIERDFKDSNGTMYHSNVSTYIFFPFKKKIYFFVATLLVLPSLLVLVAPLILTTTLG
jgi:hypothetical protein